MTKEELLIPESNQIFSIYKLENRINQKKYLGFSKNSEVRWETHIANAEAHRNQYIYDAINKYGWDNFDKEIIYQSFDGEHTLRVMEPYFIKFYNSFYKNGCGYNMTLGGDGIIGYRHNEEFKAKRSIQYTGEGNPFYGKQVSDENKKKVGEGVKKTRHLRIGEKAPFHGNTHSEEAKKQIGESQALDWKITFPDGHIEIVRNLKAFCRDNKLTSPLMIAVSKCQQKHHKNFKCEKITIES